MASNVSVNESLEALSIYDQNPPPPPPPSMKRLYRTELENLLARSLRRLTANDAGELNLDIETQYLGMVDPRYYPSRGYTDPTTGEKKTERVPATGGSTMMVGLHHTHPDAVIWKDRAMDRFFRYLRNEIRSGETSEEILPKLKAVNNIYNAAISLKQIHRFIADAQPSLWAYPVLDKGLEPYSEANPTFYEGFKDEFELRKKWIRSLHYKGILTFDPNTNAIQDKRLGDLTKILTISRALLHEEVTNVNEKDALYSEDEEYELNEGDPDEPSMRWVAESRYCIAELLDQLVNEACKSETDLTSTIAIMKQNFNKRTLAFFNRLIEVADKYLREHPFERLIIDILAIEIDFELALTDEHAEDMLLDKQIVMYDEESLSKVRASNTLVTPEGMIRKDLYNAYFAPKERLVRRIVKDLALVNNQRRNHRMLRDWMGQRPWAQYFQLYDSRAKANNWMAEAIQKMKESTQFQRKGSEYALYRGPGGPTRYHHVAPKLFPVMPLDLAAADPPPFLKPGTIGCALCGVRYFGNLGFKSSVLLLHCNHAFHMQCIFEKWDKPGEYLHTCPTCGHIPKLNYNHLGIRPDEYIHDGPEEYFAHNVFGYHPVYHHVVNQQHGAIVNSALAREMYSPGPELSLKDCEIGMGSVAQRNYWAAEQAHLQAGVEAVRGPVFWQGMTFNPNERAKLPIPGLDSAPRAMTTGRNRGQFVQVESQSLRDGRVFKAFGQKWIDNRWEKLGTPAAAGLTLDAFRKDTTRLLPFPRLAPEVEMARMRKFRRKLNESRRKRYAEKGIAGLK